MNYFLCSNWQDKKKEFGCGWAGRDDFRAGGTALFGLDGFATAEQGMKQGKQFFILVSVNKESGYESEKIALARQEPPQTFFGLRSSRIHFFPTVRGEEWIRDERTPKDVCGEAIARQDQIISWVTTGEYRVKDSSWNGLNNHVSKIHLNISFRLKEILKNCVMVFPLPHSPQRFTLNKINVIITKIIGERKKHGPGVHGPPVMDRVRGQFFFNNEKLTKTEKVPK